MPRERLDKMLTGRGAGSRRAAAAKIRAGEVQVNGMVCRDPAQKVNPEADVVCVAGQPLRMRRERYLMMNKPAGVITATEDAMQQTVLDLLPADVRRGLSPVGRLDKDTEGLLLLTDDGALTHALTAPRRHVDKRYRVHIAGTLAADAVMRFAAGLTLGDGTVCRPADLTFLDQTEDGLCVAEVVLREGKYHQVKRMVAAAGGRVVYLKRLSMGPLKLDAALPAGGWRELTEQELALLKAAAQP